MRGAWPDSRDALDAPHTQAAHFRPVMGCVALVASGSWVKVPSHPPSCKSPSLLRHTLRRDRPPSLQLTCLVRIDSLSAVPPQRRRQAKLSRDRAAYEGHPMSALTAVGDTCRAIARRAAAAATPVTTTATADAATGGRRRRPVPANSTTLPPRLAPRRSVKRYSTGRRSRRHPAVTSGHRYRWTQAS